MMIVTVPIMAERSLFAPLLVGRRPDACTSHTALSIVSAKEGSGMVQVNARMMTRQMTRQMTGR